ncbi:MAG TPA: DNA mismatch repair endonuclease MutL [Clostridiales bacterium]|nr:DNA mismatch repair endonuclease MutL [Clostridiales bacterium]
MGKIVTLDENTINKIAAGEVVERPASVIKELVENSIDAGSTRIVVEIKKGGIPFIKVIDNGIGIDEDDVEIAFERHSTSKIRHSDDLPSILTLGFRGEALASIAAVSKVEMITRTQNKHYGIKIIVNGGNVEEIKQTGAPAGTSITIRDLFYNTPARYKFLKRDSTEAGYVSDIVNRIALGHPEISLKFVNNGTALIHTPGNNDLLSTIASIYGTDITRHLSEINYQDEFIKLIGYAGGSETSRANRNHQSIFINGRYIRSKLITSAIDEAYKTFLMKNKFAFVILKIEINTAAVDVNVHPAKMEVRFSNEQEIFRSIYHAVSNTLLGGAKIPEVKYEKHDINTNIVSEKQQNINFENRNININDKNIISRQNTILNENEYKSEINPRTGTADTADTANYIHKPALKINKDIYDSNIYTNVNKNTNASTKTNDNADINTNVNYNEISSVNINTTTYHNDNNFNSNTNNNTTSNNKINDIKDARIIGQLFSTYILLQKNDNFFVIDQHAAHERIMFEKMKEKFFNNQQMAQILLVPVVVELTYQELEVLLENKELFTKMGFTFEDFGNNSIILRSIPYKEQGDDGKELFLQLLDYISTYSRSPGIALEEEALYLIACKAAIKANMHLDDLEKFELIKELMMLDNPYTCPHGRPTILKITKDELEKMFKRKI